MKTKKETAKPETGVDLMKVDVLVKFGDGTQLVLLAQAVTGPADDAPLALNPDELDPTVPRASRDFASVWWNGTLWTFTKNQRPIVQALWIAWQKGSYYVGGDFLLELAGCESKSMSQVFKKSPAWRNLIVSGAMLEDGPPDTYRLVPLAF